MVMAIELTDNTIDKLITGIEKIIDKSTKEEEKLYNLTELCRILNVKYNTFKTKKLPYIQTEKNSKKLYSLPKVKKYLGLYD